MDGGAARRAARAPIAALVLLLFSAIVSIGACNASAPPPSGPANVVLITLDTTRADRLGAYGYERPTSPTLDRLAAESEVYERAYSTSSWTLPAHASLFTGMLPTSHGADKDPGGSLVLSAAVDTPDSWKMYRASAPREDVPTLAELLQQAGYATGAVVGGPWMKRVFGLARGFAFYDDANVGADGRPGAEITASARAWLAEQQQPFFLFLNYFDPHTPYSAPPEYAKRVLGGEKLPSQPTQRQIQSLLYDAEILYTDDQLAQLFAELRRLGVWDSTWIVVTADHGELLGEHGRTGHGLTLDEPVVRVPLIVKAPADRARRGRRDAPVQITDVMPILLDGLALPIPPSVQGSLPGQRKDPLLAELDLLPAESEDGEYKALIDGDWKLLWSSRAGTRLYDVGDDPGETRDRSQTDAERTASMRARLDGFVAGLPRPPSGGPARTVDPETIEALRGLGYVE